MAITADIVTAIKVQFLKPIFEDDFPERGMTAWLTGVEYNKHVECYNLHFDFTEFEADNDKYFVESYYANRHTDTIDPDRARLYTAKEAGMYSPKYSVYFSVRGDDRNDQAFADDIVNYLQEVK